MPIKAKRVDPQRAIEVARGQLGTFKLSHESARIGPSSSIFEHSRQPAAALGNDDDDSSTSTSSEITTAPEGVLFSGRMGNPYQEPYIKSDHFNATEEVLLAAARERTKALLYPKSESIAHNHGKTPVASQHNVRLLKYERTKAHKNASMTVREALIASATPNSSSNIDASEPLESDTSTPDLPQNSGTDDINNSRCLSNSDKDGTESMRHAQTVESFPKVDTTDNNHLDPLQENFERLSKLLGKYMQTSSESNAVVQQQESVPAKSANPVDRGVKSNARLPPHTFAELEQEALEQLYCNWCNRAQDEDSQSSSLFVAADHTAEALAISKAICLRKRGTTSEELVPTDLSLLADEPMSLEELAIAPHVRRSLAVRPSPANLSEEDALSKTPAALSQQAQERLNRFWLSVMWVERLVSSTKFVRWLAGFLYGHHKIFMKYATNQSKGKPFQKIIDHDHEEYAVYEEFGQCTSTALVHVLTQHVPDFEEAEFVEALYDYPANLDPGGNDEHDNGSFGSQGILSYQAWRIILAMSDFESFFLWMMDYIKEEYEVELGSEVPVAVGGARGLRALLRSTYRFGGEANTISRNITLPLSPTVPPTEGSFDKSSPGENVMDPKSPPFSFEEQTEVTVSQTHQTIDTTFFFITDPNTLSRPDTVPDAMPPGITTQASKLLTPTPPASACSHRFFTPNKTLAARAFRNLPALQVPCPSKASLERRTGSEVKDELRGSYPGALNRDTNSKGSGNGPQSTDEVPFAVNTTTRSTSVKKKNVRFNSSAPPKVPATRSKSKKN
ncbi:unnamed protein product [Phytomonas sp. EM1]|nr:unnamed protein product [Phytomonas sp. EM1]|eukprot:CCW62700.1 unnamed protein product [Phytomonas sp. isolate EM1]